MSNFVVSARKYRPDHFNTVVGQSHITKTLKTAIKNNQLAQAFLFCGPRGVGKTSCARILAKTINCTNLGEDYEACGTCASCISFKNGNSFNIHELDAASNNSVEDIRSLVEQVRYAPQAGKYKIYIIDEVHMLSSSAFNAFLKTLEEPPPYAIFILATTEKHKIIPTILSRCQIFDFHRIRVKDIAAHLQYIAKEEAIQFEPEALHIIAQKADGALRDALSSFDQLAIFTDSHISYKAVIENLNILDYDYYFRVTDALLDENTATALLIFEDILRNGFSGNDFINGLCSHFRDLLVSRDESTIALLEVSEQTQGLYLEQTRKTSASFLLSALTIGNQCEINYRNSKNPRLQVELALMKMCHIQAAFKLKSDPQVAEKKNASAADGRTNLDLQSTPLSSPIHPPSQAVSLEENTDPSKDLVGGHLVPNAPTEKLNTKEHIQEQLVTNDPTEKFSVTDKVETIEKLKIKNSRSTAVKFRIPSAGELKKTIDEGEVLPSEVSRGEADTESILAHELISHWHAYTDLLLAQQKKNIYTILSNYDPSIEGNSIHIKISNLIEKDIVEPEIPDLQFYLCEKMGRRSLKIFTRIMEPTEEKKTVLFTPLEKFNYMAKKNPYLFEFKQTFQLDLNR